MFYVVIREVYSEASQESKTEVFSTTRSSKPLTDFAKSSILDVLQGSEYACGNATSVQVAKK